MWTDRRIIELFGIEHPIVLAPMAGPGTASPMRARHRGGLRVWLRRGADRDGLPLLSGGEHDHVHKDALKRACDDGTALTNLFTGRPARGVVSRIMREVGPLSPDAPAFPWPAARSCRSRLLPRRGAPATSPPCGRVNRRLFAGKCRLAS